MSCCVSNSSEKVKDGRGSLYDESKKLEKRWNNNDPCTRYRPSGIPDVGCFIPGFSQVMTSTFRGKAKLLHRCEPFANYISGR
jgi:hypothetical protein